MTREDPESKPETPGAGRDEPFERGGRLSGEPSSWNGPWSLNRDDRDDRDEVFPHLSDEGAYTGKRIDGLWGWAPLITILLFFIAVLFTPTDSSSAAEQADEGLGIAVIVLAVIVAPYALGSIAAFNGNRKGLTWTLPVSILVFVFMLLYPIAGPLGLWIVGLLTFSVAALVVHIAAVKMSKAPEGVFESTTFD